MKKNALKIFLFSIFAGSFLMLPWDSVRAAEWYSSSWLYREGVNILDSKVEGASALENFPVLINITDSKLKYTGNGGKVAKANGGDILFTSSDGTTKLSHEIEKYDPATGELAAWVKIPSLSATKDTSIYLYYGNFSAGNEQDPENVWEDNYKAVWHLKEDYPGITIDKLYKDSTQNNLDGNDRVAATGKNGKIGYGQEFGGADGDANDNDHIDFSSNDSKYNLSDKNFTVQLWFKIIGQSSNYSCLFSRSTGGTPGAGWSSYAGQKKDGSNISFNFRTDGGNTLDLPFGGSYVDSTWHQMALTVDQASKKGWIYIDGQQKASDTWTGNLINYNSTLYVGGVATVYTFPGNLDEIRIAHTTHSADWIKTEYNNQNSPGTFYQIMSEELVSPWPEGDAPLLGDGKPSGKLIIPQGAATASLSLTTNKNATCKYSNLFGTSYDLMENTFAATGGTSHSQDAAITDGNSYNYYVRCRDELGHTNESDYKISFAVTLIQTNGLWGHYGLSTDGTQYTYINSSVESINFTAFQSRLQSILGRSNNVAITWKGYLYAPKAGVYRIRFDTNGNQGNYLYLDDQSLWWTTGDGLANVMLEAGWHDIDLYLNVTNGTNGAILYWTPPGESETIISANLMNHETWSERRILIPDPSKGKARVNYVVSGVGTNGRSGPSTIIIKLPAEVAAGDVLTDEVWTIWQGAVSTSTVTNLASGVSRTISLEKSRTKVGLSTGFSGGIAKLPSELITFKADKTLNLSFTGGWDGLGIIVPYNDATLPKPGRIDLWPSFSGSYRSPSQVFIYPIDYLENEETELNPFFMLYDGETKITSSASCTGSPCPRYRPNYMVWSYGTAGNEPAETDILAKRTGAMLLVPEESKTSGPLNASNPDTFYPSYGREGAQFDVLSTKYTPNLWPTVHDKYATELDGAFDNSPLKKVLEVPPKNNWVAFQHVGSNLPPGVFLFDDGVQGSGESGGILGGGIFATLDPDIPVLIICPSTPTTLPLGSSSQLSAYYIASGSITCSDTTGATDVTASADWNSDNGTIVSVDNDGNKGLITGNTMGGPVDVNATYSSLLASSAITVISPCLCNTGCEAFICPGTSCPNSCGNSVCDGTKNCQAKWKEVAP
ncbi:MAG: DUF2341 domain-containing protein [Parcubacteria group bacterium]